MGAKSSKSTSERRFSCSGSTASSWDQSGYLPSPYPTVPQHNSYNTPQHHYAPQTSINYEPYSYTPQRPKKLDRRYSRIADNYRSLDEVTSALASAGLESSNLIVGIDFTKSNEWTGSRSFNKRSLHYLGHGQNPYEQAISIIGKTLSAFDEDNLIPCFGFGDASTHDQDVFCFYPNERKCNGFEEVLARYREIVPHLKLAGPTSFAPIIEMAMTIVEQSRGQYHVLLIIADGQVTRSIDTEHGQLSPQEQKTIDAIVRASEYPLSIVLVGVGDGPWDMMMEFDDNIPARAFDNFQFVNFTDIMAKNVDALRKQTEFALSALMEIPFQYKATIELSLLGGQTGNTLERVPLPPPVYGTVSSDATTRTSRSSSFLHRKPSYTAPDDASVSINTPSPSSFYYDSQVCPVCLTNTKNMAFGCGHQTCFDCGELLEFCPICRTAVQTRIRLY